MIKAYIRYSKLDEKKNPLFLIYRFLHQIHSGGDNRARILRLLHKKMLPQTALKGRQEGPEGCGRSEIGSTVGQYVQGQGKAYLVSNTLW